MKKRSLSAEALGEGGPFFHETTAVKYVYLIQSITYPDHRYVGITSDVRKRLTAHNEGRSPHTSKFKPWKLITYLGFTDSDQAREFERYLKTGSGRAFANRHFWS